MKTISKTAVAALTLAIASFASQAQAHTEIRILGKSGVPYLVTHEYNASRASLRKITKHDAVHVRMANKNHVIR